MSTALRSAAIERVNPAVRVVLALVATTPLLVTVDWVSASVALALELLVLVAVGVRPVALARLLLPLFWLAPLGAVSLLLYGDVGGQVYWRFGPAVVSEQSVRLAQALFVRIFALAVPVIALLRGLDSTRMADGLAQVLRLPSRFVLGSLAGFRLMGLLTQDWRSLEQARRARGLADRGRVRHFATMGFGLLVIAIRRGTKMATAMEARGFGAPGITRSWARPSRLGRADLVAVLTVVAVDAAALSAAWRAGTLWTILS